MQYDLCSSKKIAYDSEVEIQEALIQSQINFTDGATNYYVCNICGCYHLTSSQEKNEILSDFDVQKRIEKERIAKKLGY